MYVHNERTDYNGAARKLETLKDIQNHNSTINTSETRQLPQANDQQQYTLKLTHRFRCVLNYHTQWLLKAIIIAFFKFEKNIPSLNVKRENILHQEITVLVEIKNNNTTRVVI